MSEQTVQHRSGPKMRKPAEIDPFAEAAETVRESATADDGEVLPVRRRHLGETAVIRDPSGALALDVRFINGHREFRGRSG